MRLLSGAAARPLALFPLDMGTIRFFGARRWK